MDDPGRQLTVRESAKSVPDDCPSLVCLTDQPIIKFTVSQLTLGHSADDPTSLRGQSARIRLHGRDIPGYDRASQRDCA